MSDETYIKMDNEPFDRLTRIVGALSDTFRDHPERENGERAIVIIKGQDGGPGAVTTAGYSDSREVLLDLLMETSHVLQAHGIERDLLDVLKGSMYE